MNDLQAQSGNSDQGRPPDLSISNRLLAAIGLQQVEQKWREPAGR